jgi:hypothetical protein
VGLKGQIQSLNQTLIKQIKKTQGERMKQILVIGLCILLTKTNSFAGNPAEDVATRHLQRLFAIGRIPTLADLNLRKIWECIDHNATGDRQDWDLRESTKTFSNLDGIIYEIQSGGRVNTYAYAENGELTNTQPDTFYKEATPYMAVVRITRYKGKNYLIIEWSARVSIIKEPQFFAKSAESAIDPHYRVISYPLCQLK